MNQKLGPDYSVSPTPTPEIRRQVAMEYLCEKAVAYVKAERAIYIAPDPDAACDAMTAVEVAEREFVAAVDRLIDLNTSEKN